MKIKPETFKKQEMHHIFCNHPDRPYEGCSCCKMKEKYGNDSPEEIMKKHFPDVIKREGT